MKYGLIKLSVAAGLMAWTVPATAADLGGDCCADLEERVAELEANVVRKNKRQLSMTISGRLNAAVLHHDPGVTFTLNDDGDVDAFSFGEKDTAVVHGPGGKSKVMIDGRATIRPGLEAGYRFSFEFAGVQASNISHWNRPTEDGIAAGEAYWFIRSAKLGAISVGTRGTSFGSAAKVDISGKTSFVANVDPSHYMGGMFGFLAQQNDGDGGVSDRAGVRYDSPTFAGFILTADWTNKNNQYDTLGLRLSYANQHGDFRIAGAAAYWKDDDARSINATGLALGSIPEASGVLGSLGVMHVPTGLFVNLGAGQMDTGIVGDSDSRHWSAMVGLQKKFWKIGNTTIYGQYYSSSNNSLFTGGALFSPFGKDEYDLDYYGVGLVQTIDAASMDLYIGYRKYDSTPLSLAGDDWSLKADYDSDVIIAGGVIHF